MSEIHKFSCKCWDCQERMRIWSERHCSKPYKIQKIEQPLIEKQAGEKKK